MNYISSTVRLPKFVFQNEQISSSFELFTILIQVIPIVEPKRDSLILKFRQNVILPRAKRGGFKSVD